MSGVGWKLGNPGCPCCDGCAECDAEQSEGWSTQTDNAGTVTSYHVPFTNYRVYCDTSFRLLEGTPPSPSATDYSLIKFAYLDSDNYLYLKLTPLTNSAADTYELGVVQSGSGTVLESGEWPILNNFEPATKAEAYLLACILNDALSTDLSGSEYDLSSYSLGDGLAFAVGSLGGTADDVFDTAGFGPATFYEIGGTCGGCVCSQLTEGTSPTSIQVEITGGIYDDTVGCSNCDGTLVFVADRDRANPAETHQGLQCWFGSPNQGVDISELWCPELAGAGYIVYAEVSFTNTPDSSPYGPGYDPDGPLENWIHVKIILGGSIAGGTVLQGYKLLACSRGNDGVAAFSGEFELYPTADYPDWEGGTGGAAGSSGCNWTAAVMTVTGIYA